MRRARVLCAAVIALAACAEETVALHGDGGRDAAAPPSMDADARAAADADALVSVDARVDPVDARVDPVDARVDPLDAAPPDLGAPDGGAGLPVGSACERAEQCASASNPLASLEPGPCLLGNNNPWPNGYCIDYCTLPPDPLGGAALVRADCPEGAVCVPRFESPGQAPPGGRPEIGACFKECTADAECRVDEPVPGFGYYCRKHFAPTSSSRPPYTNGYCAAPHCSSRGCPSSFICGC